MCREKQEAEPGFPEIKPDDCPMLITLSQMTATETPRLTLTRMQKQGTMLTLLCGLH